MVSWNRMAGEPVEIRVGKGKTDTYGEKSRKYQESELRG
jgi:hypothetical protein